MQSFKMNENNFLGQNQNFRYSKKKLINMRPLTVKIKIFYFHSVYVCVK